MLKSENNIKSKLLRSCQKKEHTSDQNAIKVQILLN